MTVIISSDFNVYFVYNLQVMIEFSNSSELQVWCEVDVRRAQDNSAFYLCLILVTSFVLGECFCRKALLSLQ